MFNDEMNDNMKILKSLQQSGLLIKGVRETIKNEGKEQKGVFLSKLLGILGASLLINLLGGKSTIRAGEGTIRGDEGTVGHIRIFNAASFFNKFWNKNVLSERT